MRVSVFSIVFYAVVTSDVQDRDRAYEKKVIGTETKKLDLTHL